MSQNNFWQPPIIYSEEKLTWGAVWWYLDFTTIDRSSFPDPLPPPDGFMTDLNSSSHHKFDIYNIGWGPSHIVVAALQHSKRSGNILRRRQFRVWFNLLSLWRKAEISFIFRISSPEPQLHLYPPPPPECPVPPTVHDHPAIFHLGWGGGEPVNLSSTN